jgi:hypothetical protein
MRRLFLPLIAALSLAAAPAAAQVALPVQPTASTAPASGLVLANQTAFLQGIQVTSGATAGYVLVLDAALIPASGAVQPKRCYPLAANTGIEPSYRGAPVSFGTGIVILFSTTGCFTYTPSATAFIEGDARW